MAVNNFDQNAAGFVPTTQIILYFRGIPLCLPADHSLTAYLLDVSVHWHLSAVSNTHSLLCITAQSVTPALALALDTLVFVAILTPTLQLILEKRRLGLSHSKFVERFVRDGGSYFF